MRDLLNSRKFYTKLIKLRAGTYNTVGHSITISPKLVHPKNVDKKHYKRDKIILRNKKY